MKIIPSFFFFLACSIALKAQVLKTVNVTTAGTLSSLLTPTEQSAITNLTVTGTLNSTDFATLKTMASSDVLSVINLSGTTIDGNTIPDNAFYGCLKLTSITLPNSVTSIGNYTFVGCNGLTTFTIPNSITSIGNYTFFNCSGLTSLYIPNAVTSIGNYAFWNCTGLTSVIIPNSVTSIGNYAFDFCTSLASVILPNSVTSIGVGVFYCCRSLTSVIIPNSITSIGNYAFYGCISLISVTIPNSVTSIGNYAFYGCVSLSSVYVYNTNPGNIVLGGSLIFDGIKSPATLYVPLGFASQYIGWASHTWDAITAMQSSILNISTNTASLSCTEGSTASVSVTSNAYWKVGTLPSWLSVSASPSNGYGDAALTFSAIANINTVRTTAITLTTYDNAVTQTITLTQAGELPAVSTQESNNITATTANGNGNIIDFGTTAATSYGICYSSTNDTPTINDSKADLGTATTTGVFTVSLTGLTPNTLYYARTFATNTAGTSYGEVVSFTTLKIQLTIADPVLSSKEYDGATDATPVVTPGALTGILSGFPNVTVSVASAIFDTKTVGTGKTITISYSLSGIDKDKYIVPVNAVVTTGEIKVKGLIINATAQSKTYDGNQTAIVSGATLNGVVSGDVVILTLGTASFADKNAGNNKPVTVMGSSLSGTDAGKYSLSEPSGLTADITSKAIIVTADAGQTKVYGNADPTFTYTVSPALVGSDAFTGNLTRAMGENVGSYAIVQGSLSAGNNYSISFVSNNFSVTAKQLTITESTVVTSKMYDGTTSAMITDLGQVNGIISTDAANVSVSGTATYNDASVGINKTITLVYSFSGSAAGNYLAPANVVISGAQIEDIITLATLQSSKAGCEGEDLSLSYTILSGTPVQYRVVFDSKAINAGFSDINYTNLLTSGQSGTITIPVPSGIADGVYTASLQMVNELNNASILYPFIFTINLSSDYIITKFDDVVLCNNVSNRFTTYQWYKDDVAINGATKQFYNDPQGLSGTYAVQVVTTSGETLMSCAKTITSSTFAKVSLTVFPNPVSPNQNCTVKISGLSDDDLQGARLAIYNMEGQQVYYTVKVEQLSTLSMKGNSGTYIGYLITMKNGDYTFRIVVAK